MLNKNYLNERFYELVDEGFIYDEDENGLGMAYGEYSEIELYLQTKACEYLIMSSSSKLELLENIRELIDNSDDDSIMFMGYDRDDLYLYYDIDDDGEIVDLESNDFVDYVIREFEYVRG